VSEFIVSVQTGQTSANISLYVLLTVTVGMLC